MSTHNVSGAEMSTQLRSVRVRDARLSDRSTTHPVLLRRSVKLTGVRGSRSYLSRQQTLLRAP